MRDARPFIRSDVIVAGRRPRVSKVTPSRFSPQRASEVWVSQAGGGAGEAAATSAPTRIVSDVVKTSIRDLKSMSASPYRMTI
jgi:hypothetical protein